MEKQLEEIHKYIDNVKKVVKINGGINDSIPETDSLEQVLSEIKARKLDTEKILSDTKLELVMLVNKYVQ